MSMLTGAFYLGGARNADLCMEPPLRSIKMGSGN